jgi:hypothetical protein
MDWFDDYIEDVFGKESYYVNRVIRLTPQFDRDATDRVFRYRIKSSRNVFRFGRQYARAVELHVP